MRMRNKSVGVFPDVSDVPGITDLFVPSGNMPSRFDEFQNYPALVLALITSVGIESAQGVVNQADLCLLMGSPKS